MTEKITSPQNEKLKLVRRLGDRRGRDRERLFCSEGEDLLEAGLAAGWRPELVLTSRGSGVEGVETDPDLLASVSALGSGTRVIAVWGIPEPQPPGERCVYLHGIGDPGNVGTVIRTAAALGPARVLLGPGCADPYSPKAVRATMGALFATPPLAAGIEVTPRPRLALVAHGGNTLEGALTETVPRTLCLGSERDGLDTEVLASCEGRATIALVAGAESLNVAAAAAIALHRISSARAGGEPG